MSRIGYKLTDPDSVNNPDAKTRFWKAIFYSPDGCWYWTRTVSDRGYGQLIHYGKRMGAHRFSYLIHKGQIPPGLLVCHHCDNKLCVNPDHLFIGTHQDNTRDMMAKGRQWVKGKINKFETAPAIIFRGHTIRKSTDPWALKYGNIYTVANDDGEWNRYEKTIASCEEQVLIRLGEI